MNEIPFIRYIAGAEHYNEVLARVAGVKSRLWIGTADIKDLYVMCGGKSVPFLGLLDMLLRRNVEVRLVHAKEPGPAFREEFDKHPALATGLERALCPRVHFKLVIFDLGVAYIGSANLTGAGMGMKSETRRNFEAGILTNIPSLVGAAVTQFDTVWAGGHCRQCGRKRYCPDRIRFA